MNYQVGEGRNARVFPTMEEANRYANEIIRVTKEGLIVTETTRGITHCYSSPKEIKHPEDKVTVYYTPRDSYGQRIGEVREWTMPREEYEWKRERGWFFFDTYYEAQLAAMFWF